MFIDSKYRKLFDKIRVYARESIIICKADENLRPGINYLSDHFLFDLPIYRNLRIVKMLAGSIPKKSKILDWGCGYGDSSLMLKTLRPDLKITLFDVMSSPPWDILTKKENLNKIVIENETKLPFESDYFDAVVGIGVLEHVKDQKRSLREIYRILKPGGKFYIFLYPNKNSYTERFQKFIGHPHHDKPLNLNELKKLLHNSGFYVEKEGYQLILPIMLSRFPFIVRNIYNFFGNVIVFSNYIIERMPILNRYSSNLMVICMKKQ